MNACCGFNGQNGSGEADDESTNPGRCKLAGCKLGSDGVFDCGDRARQVLAVVETADSTRKRTSSHVDHLPKNSRGDFREVPVALLSNEMALRSDGIKECLKTTSTYIIPYFRYLARRFFLAGVRRSISFKQ
jgi:hypothetical protein